MNKQEARFSLSLSLHLFSVTLHQLIPSQLSTLAATFTSFTLFLPSAFKYHLYTHFAFHFHSSSLLCQFEPPYMLCLLLHHHNHHRHHYHYHRHCNHHQHHHPHPHPHHHYYQHQHHHHLESITDFSFNENT